MDTVPRYVYRIERFLHGGYLAYVLSLFLTFHYICKTRCTTGSRSRAWVYCDLNLVFGHKLETDMKNRRYLERVQKQLTTGIDCVDRS